MIFSVRRTRLIHMAGLMLAMFVWLANNSNPPTGNTGAPFDGTCNGCHSGGNFQGTVEVSGMPGTVSANTAYPLSITVTPTGGSPIRGGFQLVAVDGNNANCGNLANSNAQSGTEFFGGREYLEHRGGKAFGGNPISWDFTWTSPSSVAGNTVKFYMIGNFTNGNGGTSGDNAIPFLETYAFAGPPPVTATITSTINVSCFGGNTGSATVEADGGNPPYTYLWNNGQNQSTAVNLIAGTYTVTVSGSSGSGSATATAVITQPPVITLTATPAGSITCLNPEVNVTANAGGGVGGFNFAWSNGDTGNPASYSTPGSGSVVVTDANGCTKAATFNISSNLALPSAAASSANSFTCTTPNIALSGAGSSTGNNFTYFWSAGPGGNIVSGGTTLTPTVSGCATYTLQVTNNLNGCSSTASVTPACNVVPPNASATGATLTCAAPTVTISANSTTPNVTYSWAGPNNYTSTLQNPSVTASGTYTVTVRNTTNNCTATATASVGQNTAPPNASASGGTLTCAATSVSLSGNSTTPSATYSWVGPNNFTSTLQNPSVSVAGTYTLTVNNPANGCTATATASVGQNNAEPNISASGGTLTCAATSVSLSGNSTTPSATYSWAGPNNFTSTLQNPSVSVAGTYTLTVNNPVNGCTATATASVAQNNAEPNVSASGGTLTCAATSVSLSGNSTTPSATYLWAGPGGFTSNLQNPMASAVGTYTLTVRNPANGCTATATASVGQNTVAPLDSITPPPSLNCLNLIVTIDASASSQGANFDYQWTARNGGHIVSGDTSLTPSVDSAGRYILLITNTLNGCTATDSVTVGQTPPVTAAATATAVGCFGGNNGTATATAGGGNGAIGFVWSNGDSTPVIINLSAGTYIVVATDADGCTASASVTVTQPTVLTANASATGQTAVGLNDGTATAAPTGGTSPYTYLWNNSGTTASITDLAPGNYTVSVTDANGCSAVQTVTVNAFGCNLVLAAGATDVTCHGAANGTAWVNVNGANLPVEYAWSNSGNTQMISDLGPGTYTVSVTDAANCEAVQSVTVSEPTALQPNATATGQTAVGVNDGTATAAPTGGTGVVTFLWSTGATAATITGLAPGTYTVVVTDANGCTAQQSVTVSAFNCNLSLALASVNPACFGFSNGSLSASASGATGNLTYLWNTGATTATLSNLSAGTYTVVATDAAGCSVSSTASITQPTVLVTEVSNVVNVNCPLNAAGSAMVTASGGTAPYTIAWPNGSNGTSLTAGTYTVSATDANACTTTATVVIASLDTEVPSINCPGNIVVCGADLITYQAPNTNDNCSPKPIPMLVSGQASGTPFKDGVTTQVFRATDLSGNSATCSFSVTVHPIPDVTVLESGNDTNGLGVGFIKVKILGGNAPYTFVWYKDNEFFSNEQDLDSLKVGAYRLVMTDGNGCSVNLSPTFIQNTVGTDDLWQLSGLRLWPNPVREAFRLEMNGLDVVAAQVFTSQGQLAQVILPAELSGEVSVAQLPAGLYYLKIVTRQGQSGVVKWVKGAE